MLKTIIILSLTVAALYCTYIIYAALYTKQPIRKDLDMVNETKKSIWLSGLLIITNVIGIAYLWNPKKFEEKTSELKEKFKKIFSPTS